MQNFIDNLVGGRAWRIWARNLARAGEMSVQFASEDADYQGFARPEEVQHLTTRGTEIAREWTVIREQLCQTYDSRFSDKDARDLRREAIKRRMEVRGYASFVQSRNVNRGYYQPYYNLFQDMAERQVELWDALLELCDARDPQHLDTAIRILGECETLGEEALLRLPILVNQRRKSDRKRMTRILIWSGAVVLVVLLAVIAAAVYL